MSDKHLVCQGAVCRCTYGLIEDRLMVLTQSKRYINDGKGGSKLIATHKDIGFTLENNSFGTCKKRGSPPPPCIPAIKEWQDYYENITIEDNGGKALLEDSIAVCETVGAACIKIKWHGQSAGATAQNYQAADEALHAALNPAVDMQAFKEETQGDTPAIG